MKSSTEQKGGRQELKLICATELFANLSSTDQDAVIVQIKELLSPAE